MSLRHDILFLLLTFSGALFTKYVAIPSAIKDKPASLHQLDVLDNRNEGDLARFVGEEDGDPAVNPESLAFLSPAQTQILGIDFPKQDIR